MAKSNLEKAIEQAAGNFALEVVEAVKGATLEELIALQSDRVRKKPGPKPKVRKKRVAKNYPKCAFPSCNKNRFPRGKGFCGEHYNKFVDGKIKSAESYKKKTAKKGPTKKKVAKKKAAKKK